MNRSFLTRNKLHLVYFFIFLTTLSLLLLSSKNSDGYPYKYILKNKISSIIGRTERDKLPYNDNLPSAKIKFDKNWTEHIEKLNALVQKRDFETYLKLNKYFKGSIKIDGEKYNVKVKVHGKSPDGHIYKNNTSLKIKFKNNKNPFKSKKVKLIIDKRLVYSYDNMKVLGDYFDLYKTEGYWYNIKINNNESYPYLVQIPMGKDYLSNYLKDSNLVDFAEAPYYVEEIKENGEIDYHLKDELLKNEIQKLFRNLTSDIKKSNFSQVFNYFDKEYLTKFTACNLVGGFLGHGFDKENIYLLYNKKDKKLYPLITRDNFISPLQSNRNEFDQIMVWEHFSTGYYKKVKNDLLTFLYGNDELRTLALDLIDQKSIKKLQSLIKSHKNNMSLKTSFLDDLLQTKDPFEEKKRLSWKSYDLDLILENFEKLKRRIQSPQYSSYEYLANDSITVLLTSHSIYPLYINSFSFSMHDENIKEMAFKLYTGEKCILDTILPCNESKTGLIKLIGDQYLFETKNLNEPLFHTIKINFLSDSTHNQCVYNKESFKTSLTSKSTASKKISPYISNSYNIGI